MKPISNTAFYCCGVRMEDAEQSEPVCGDIYAKNFMSEEGLQIFAAFKEDVHANASNVARARIIDDILRKELLSDGSATVVLIGAGFDSRAFRLNGGTWVEVDEPQIIAYKNERLPAQGSTNELHRISIDFANESLEEKLAPFAGRSPAIVVVEGVLMYLDEEDITRMLQTLRRIFPSHKLICDLMNRKFFEKYSAEMHKKITGLGAPFRFTVDDPEKLILASGYDRLGKISIVEAAVGFGSLNIPAFLLKTIFHTLAGGYAIFEFEASMD